MPQINLLLLKQIPIYQQLQIEEALLRADQRNWCLINHGTSPAIVTGVSAKVEEWIDLSAAAQDNIPIIRRFSGGGTVVVDEETLFVTFIMHKQALPIPLYPEPLLRWTANFYQPILGPYGFQLNENDYAIQTRKFGGNAQYIRKERWLHHTSHLWNFSPTRMRYLKQPPRMPTYRQQRSHEEFLCKLKDYLPSPESFLNACITQLHTLFNVQETTLQEVQPLVESTHRKSLERIR